MKTQLSRYFLLVTALLYSASAQTTRTINVNVSGSSTIAGVIAGSGAGNGTVKPFGNAAVSLATTQSADANFNPVGPVQDTVTFSFNRLDSFSVTATSPDLST